MDPTKLKNFVEIEFKDKILPSFTDFLKIPCVSQSYDPDWEKRGDLTKAANLFANFARNFGINGLTVDVFEDASPLIIVQVNPTDPKETFNVVMYGHLDKQPPFVGWDSDKGPYTPVIKDDRLYARGSADDGWAFYGALLSIKSIQNQGVPHPRIVILIESCEESGSPDLAMYLTKYADKIGTPNLIVCLDSGAGTYDNFWLTNSLRGVVGFDLTVNVLTRGVHSGKFSGIIPDSFMIIKNLISRLEDYNETGVRIKELEVDIPQDVIDAAQETMKALGPDYFTNQLPVLQGEKFLLDDPTQLYLNGLWKPSLTVVGAGGLPSLLNAGNVLRPSTTLRISIRIPPTLNCNDAFKIIKKILMTNVPFNADVQITNSAIVNGVKIPMPDQKLSTSINKVCKAFFGKDNYYQWGVGGSIPFVQTFSSLFPDAKLLITGSGGNDSNCHGPNENLNLGFCKKVICSLASIVADWGSYKG